MKRSPASSAASPRISAEQAHQRAHNGAIVSDAGVGDTERANHSSASGDTSSINDTTSTSDPTPTDDAARVVRHVAIIMDGNGRWATSQGMPRAAGHREGVEAARRAVKAAKKMGVGYLTLYSFSTENWRRPANEVRDLMDLLRKFVATDLPKLSKEGVRVRIIGDRAGLDFGLRKLVERAEAETAHNNEFFLQIAFNYGGRDEIVRMAQAVANRVASGSLSAGDICEETLAEFLDTDGIPDPDLVIRTSGEKRISNFLIWQAAYAEYVFLEAHWPDFDEAHFQTAINDYRARDRRFGGVRAVNPQPDAHDSAVVQGAITSKQSADLSG